MLAFSVIAKQSMTGTLLTATILSCHAEQERRLRLPKCLLRTTRTQALKRAKQGGGKHAGGMSKAAKQALADAVRLIPSPLRCVSPLLTAVSSPAGSWLYNSC